MGRPRAWHPSARAGSATASGPRGVAVSTPALRIATTTTLTNSWRDRLRPESHCRGSGSFVLRGGGGSQEWVVALLGAHTPSKNLRPISRTQAYIAYLPGKRISGNSGLFGFIDI